MGVSEKRQNFHFGVEYPFKSDWIFLEERRRRPDRES